MVRILVVDDDPKIRSFLAQGLDASGHGSERASSGEEALELLGTYPQGYFSLILLDIMMPGASGWSVLERLREGGDPTPTIFVSARDAVEERVRGLELGADDYIIKPFDFSELLARIEAVLRRREHIPVIHHGVLTIRPAERCVAIEGTDRELSGKEFDLLLALVRAKGAVLSRTELLSAVWGIDFDPETNLVDVFIARLRQRLRPHGPRLIQTVRGKGYFLVADGD